MPTTARRPHPRPTWSNSGSRTTLKALAFIAWFLLLSAGERTERFGLVDPTTFTGLTYTVSLGLLATGFVLLVTTPLAGLWFAAAGAALTCVWTGAPWQVLTLAVAFAALAALATVPVVRQQAAARRILAGRDLVTLDAASADAVRAAYPSHRVRAFLAVVGALVAGITAAAWTVADARAIDAFRADALSGTATVLDEVRSPGPRLDTITVVEHDGVRYEITTNRFEPAVGEAVEIRYVPGVRAEAVGDMFDPHGPLVWGIPALLVPLLTARWRASRRRRVVSLADEGGPALSVTLRPTHGGRLLLDGGPHLAATVSGIAGKHLRYLVAPPGDAVEDEPAAGAARPRSRTEKAVLLPGGAPEPGVVLGLRTSDDITLVRTPRGWLACAAPENADTPTTDASGDDSTATGS